MKKEMLFKKLSIISIIVAIIGLTISYAIVSRNIGIIGSAEVGTAKWDIHFENLSDSHITGDAKVIEKPKIDSSSAVLKDFRFSLQSLGDKVEYTFDIVNSGNLDAKIGDIVKLDPKCKSRTNMVSDETLVCKNLKYKLTYTDSKVEPKVGDVLTHQERRNLTLEVSYNGDGFPTATVDVSNLVLNIIYVQN